MSARPPRRDYTGKRFGRLQVLKADLSGRNVRWTCLCDCGKQSLVATAKLTNGHTRSCGCLSREAIAESRTTHGKTKTPEYKSWQKIIERCESPLDPAFARYGGRGITIAEAWRKDFPAFLAEVGERPSPHHSIDRIDNDKGYEPGNVRWATPTEQACNRRSNVWVEIGGERMLQKDAVSRFGVPQSTFSRLLLQGLSGDEIVRTRSVLQ